MKVQLLAFVLVALPVRAEAPGGKEAEEERRALQGAWVVVRMDEDGKKMFQEERLKFIFKGDEIAPLNKGERTAWMGYRLDPTKTPKRFDLTLGLGAHLGGQLEGIYSLDGDTLKICLSSKKRPTAFVTAPGSGTALLILEREKKK
jgi:uncharacterized protein (TIGR03067 family)